MSIRHAIFSLPLIIVTTAAAFAGDTVALARQAISEDDAASRAAVAELREMGQPGLDALLAVYADEVAKYARDGDGSDEWRRIASAIDTVAMQKDAYASGLYWYTDLDEAMRAAKKRDRPILSLRLLGNLNDEFSCANSRLFRSLLYANKNISGYLRENFVLHWRSVRPAPRITVDFGDGRKIERTITGNSIHYILADDGRIIDALPGLYSPRAFKLYLEQAHDVYRRVDKLGKREKRLALAAFRKGAADHLMATRKKAFELSDVGLVDSQTGTDALSIAPIAIAKMVTEVTLLRVYDPQAQYIPSIALDDWRLLAALYEPNAEIDEASKAMIRRQNRDLSERELSALFVKLNEYVSLDTTRNDFLYRTQIYTLLDPAGQLGGDLEQLNSVVYARVFKTPASDEWLGLYSTDVYTALDGGGVIRAGETIP